MSIFLGQKKYSIWGDFSEKFKVLCKNPDEVTRFDGTVHSHPPPPSIGEAGLITGFTIHYMTIQLLCRSEFVFLFAPVLLRVVWLLCM